MVFSTAFGTALFGYLIDIGLTIEQISLVCIIYVGITLIFLISIKHSLEPIYLTKKA